MMHRMLMGALLALAPLALAAQDWPAKPVKFVVPFPPGGSVDPLARLVGAKLGESLKQQFVVENRPGGVGGTIGTAFAAKSPSASASRSRRCRLPPRPGACTAP